MFTLAKSDNCCNFFRQSVTLTLAFIRSMPNPGELSKLENSNCASCKLSSEAKSTPQTSL